VVSKLPLVFEFIEKNGKVTSDVKELVYVLVNLTPIGKDDLEPLGIGNSTLVRVMSRLRSEGQEIRFDKEIGYYVSKKKPYRMHAIIDRVEGNNAYGKLFGSFPCVVISDKPLRKGVNLIWGIIDGFDGEKLIIKRGRNLS